MAEGTSHVWSGRVLVSTFRNSSRVDDTLFPRQTPPGFGSFPWGKICLIFLLHPALGLLWLQTAGRVPFRCFLSYSLTQRLPNLLTELRSSKEVPKWGSRVIVKYWWNQYLPLPSWRETDLSLLWWTLNPSSGGRRGVSWATCYPLRAFWNVGFTGSSCLWSWELSAPWWYCMLSVGLALNYFSGCFVWTSSPLLGSWMRSKLRLGVVLVSILFCFCPWRPPFYNVAPWQIHSQFWISFALFVVGCWLWWS